MPCVRRYEGFWQNGKQHGEGRYHHLDRSLGARMQRSVDVSQIWGGPLHTAGFFFFLNRTMPCHPNSFCAWIHGFGCCLRHCRRRFCVFLGLLLPFPVFVFPKDEALNRDFDCSYGHLQRCRTSKKKKKEKTNLTHGAL